MGRKLLQSWFFYGNVAQIIANEMERLMYKEKLKEIRADKGLTQTEMAAEIGVHWRTVQNWETGFTPIPKPIQKLIDMKWGNSNGN